MRVVGEVGEAVGREVRTARLEHRLAQRLRRPRVEAVHDHESNSPSRAVGQLEHVGDVEAHVLEPRRGGVRARGSIAVAARSTPTASTSGWAAATPTRLHPHRSRGPARGRAGSGGASPWSIAMAAWPRGSACVNGRFAYGISS